MSLYFNQANPGDMLMCVMVDREDGGGTQAEEEDRPLAISTATGLTFWATWLTHGEVQLLRSGPRGFHMTCSARHRNEAIPEEEKIRGGGNGRMLILQYLHFKI